MKWSVAVIGVAGAVLTLGLTRDTYVLDQPHTRIQFRVKHLGLSTVSGHFSKFEGQFDFDSANVAASSASIVIDAASINTDHQRRDDDLRSENYLDAGQYPQITFISKRVEPVKSDRFKLHGDLAIKGITKPVIQARANPPRPAGS